jgi:hypothetical protein
MPESASTSDASSSHVIVAAVHPQTLEPMNSHEGKTMKLKEQGDKLEKREETLRNLRDNVRSSFGQLRRSKHQCSW